MKIFKTSQIREIDAYTIENEPITSFALMERASVAFFDKILPSLNPKVPITVFAGPGNNGGDALTIGRFLLIAGLNVQVYLVNPKGKISTDSSQARDKLIRFFPRSLSEITDVETVVIPEGGCIIDGLFGSGLNRPLEGIFAKIVSLINQSRSIVFSIDIPSGLFGEDNRENNKDAIVQATYTYSFQFPKLSFLLAENEQYVGKWSILDIGLHPAALKEISSSFHFLQKKDVKNRLHSRPKFSHKGSYGHALLIAGSYGKMGAATLAAKAALKAGCGLLSVHIPPKGYEIMQISVPEAMVEPDKDEKIYTEINIKHDNRFDAVGVGPGIGTEEKTIEAVSRLISQCRLPLVMDADALNIVATHHGLKEKFSPKTILTPHPKEFDRLTSPSTTGFERLQKQIGFAKKYNIIVILKGAYTCVALPDGNCFFNSTGNPGMATAGSGDVLTGIILSLLAQKYTPEEAALIGVYIHGTAGDFAAKKFSQESMTAGNIADSLGDVFLLLNQEA